MKLFWSKKPNKDLLGECGYIRLVKGRHGYILYNSNDIVVGHSIEHYGEYFESEIDIFKALIAPGDIVIDAGANIGTHSLALARIVGSGGRVIAFEPQRLIFQMLCANAAINALENIECVHAALSDRSGETRMGHVSLNQKGNFGGISLTTVPGDTPVRLVSLDDYFNYPRLRLLKIDVEGMETLVLRGSKGLLEKFRPVLYVENDRIDQSEELLHVLDELGYKSYWHLPRFHNENNYFGAKTRIHGEGFIDRGDRYEPIGFAINLLCLPKEQKEEIGGLYPLLDTHEHPLLKAWNPRFSLS